MRLTRIIQEDFVNYKKCSMFLGFSKCTMKCNAECGKEVCQNKCLLETDTIEATAEEIVKLYLQNELSEAIVMGGLEPLDDFNDVLSIVKELRKYNDDDIVIYTGYTEAEMGKQVNFYLSAYRNIIVKYGRFFPNNEPHMDDILGVELASINQYAVNVIDNKYSMLQEIIRQINENETRFAKRMIEKCPNDKYLKIVSRALENGYKIKNYKNLIAIADKLQMNDNYCPCSIAKNPNTRCVCREFRDGDMEVCRCQLFTK